MGLDMYILKAEKPTLDENRIYSYEKLMDEGYTIFSEDVIRGYSNFDYLKDVSIQLKLEVNVYDYDKIKKHFSLIEEPTVCGLANDKVLFSTKKGILEINQNQIGDFTITKIATYLVTKMKSIVELSNDYKLCDYIHDLIDEAIENCEYYKLSEDILKSIDEYTSFKYNLSKYINDTIFYKEWY